VQHLSQRGVSGWSGVDKRLIEARNRTAIHFLMLPVGHYPMMPSIGKPA
jgi:hypothetical protein